MTSNPLFYNRIQPLNSIGHANTWFERSNNSEFARNTHSVILVAAEFAAAASEYPLVFFKNQEQQFFPVALLGLEPNQNAYIDRKGQWQAQYIPAYVRCYPFILAQHPEKHDLLQPSIDAKAPGFNEQGKGQKLFEGKEPSAYLQGVIGFLQGYRAQSVLTEQIVAEVASKELLELQRITWKKKADAKKEADGEAFFYAINREKLNALDDATLSQWARSGVLEMLFLHLFSLSNLQKLSDRVEFNKK